MKKDKELKFSICMPVYKGSHLLKKSLESIFNQSFINWEIIIGDDNPLELKKEIAETKKIINSFRDNRIRYYKNSKNLGYAKNLQFIVSLAKNDVLFLMAQDDILARDALQKTHDAFYLDKNIGVVTRPYFWFIDDMNKPVRVVLPYSKNHDLVISIFDGEKEFMKIFESLGQLSGLAYMRKYIEVPFNDEVFPAHIYPFAGILKEHKCVFLKDYTVAAGIEDSQTRSISSIYDISPTESWLKMYKTVFSEEKFRQQREWGIKHITTNFIGLIQLKNYAKKGILMREIKIMVLNNPKILFNIKFYFYCFISFFTPKFILRKLVDFYKKNYLSKKIPKINFN